MFLGEDRVWLCVRLVVHKLQESLHTCKYVAWSVIEPNYGETE